MALTTQAAPTNWRNESPNIRMAKDANGRANDFPLNFYGVRNSQPGMRPVQLSCKSRNGVERRKRRSLPENLNCCIFLQVVPNGPARFETSQCTSAFAGPTDD